MIKYASLVGAIAVLLTMATGAIAGPHRVSSGQPKLKRDGWSAFRAVAVGTILRSGDLLEALDGSAAVSCDGSRQLRLTPNQIVSINKICGSQRVALRGNSGDDTAIAGGNNASIPYVISPRTQWQLESEKFTIRWNPVAGESAYTVSVYCVSTDVTCPQSLVWTKNTDQSEIQYDGTPLVPGFRYRVVVETKRGLSSLDDAANQLFFEVYDPSFYSLIESGYASIKTQGFVDESLVLALADYAVTYDLYSQAIATLEASIQEGTEVIAVYQMLARLYAQTGLNLLAKESYTKAIALAEAQGDPDALALSQKGLAKVEAQLGNPETAKTLLLNAFSNYESLGDTAMLEAVQQDLDKLN